MGNLSLRAISLGMLALLWLISTAGVSAQGVFSGEGITIYSGNTAGITLGSWGGGICKESTKNAYGGDKSIEITSKGLYQGGRLDFSKPVDLTSQFARDDAYLELVTKFRGTQETYDAWAMDVAAPSATDMYGGTATPGKQVKRIQIMLFLEGGQILESQVDISAYRLNEDGWMSVAFPLKYLKRDLNLPAYKLKRIVVTGDGSEPFYIGEIRTTVDSTPLTADAGEEKEIGKNYNVLFRGTSRSITGLKYSWDFDNSNGIQEEAVGDVVYHRFTRAGVYTVTLTVSDIFGLKKPATSTVKVTVNE